MIDPARAAIALQASQQLLAWAAVIQASPAPYAGKSEKIAMIQAAATLQAAAAVSYQG